MQAAPIPDNEVERLQALHNLLLLDTPPEERFDRVVRFAAEELDVPIALVTFIDTQRQWFKSRLGIDINETARNISFCAHAINQSDLFVVDDASKDERFFDNPLVIGFPYIRFYAGAPVRAPSGERVGTLCIIDTKPRELGEIEQAVMNALRQLVDEALAGEEGDA